MKNNIAPILAVTLALALSGCSQDKKETAGGTAVSGERDYYEIRIPDIYTPSLVYLPYIAAAKGFYEEEGVKPVFTGIIGPGQHVAAVVAGDNEVGFLHVNRTINGIAAGARIKAVVADSETSKEYPHMEYVVLDDSPLRRPTDIIGKKVGLIAMGGCHEYTPYEILKKYGVNNPQGTFEIIVVPPGNEEIPLRSGQVDIFGFHGIPIDVLERGNVRVLFDDYDIWGTEGGGTPWYFREDYIQNNPEAVRRFVATHIKAGRWINENREEARRIQAEWADIPVEKITLINYTDDGLVTEDSVRIWIDVLRGYGELKVDMAARDVYTNEFNPNSPDYKFNK